MSLYVLTLNRDLLAAPLRSGAAPNPTGTHALFSLSKYSFQDHRSEAGTYVLDFNSGELCSIPKDTKSSGYAWTGFGSEIIWQKQLDGATKFWVDDAAAPGLRQYQAGCVDALVSILKVTRLADDAFAIVALGTDSVAAEQSTYSTGRAYSSLPVRSFFAEPPVKKVLWYMRFDGRKFQGGLRFSLSWHRIDILKDTGLEFASHSSVVPMGPTNCDVSSYGFVFAGKTPEQSTYQHRRAWTSDLFFIPIFSGTIAFPIISNKGCVAFLKSEDKAKVASKNHIFFVNRACESDPKEISLHSGVGKDDWPLNPELLTWSNDESKLLVSAADMGHQRVFEILIHTSTGPEGLTNVPIHLEIGHGSISSVHRCSSSPSDRRLLVSKSSFIESSVFLVVDPSSSKSPEVLSAVAGCENLGLHRGQIIETWFKGHGDYQVHCWITRPSYFQEGEKYPVALLIHGGPHSSWQDAWGTRWNPILFAEQGYIVVSPDVTGSIGYNEEFKEAAIDEMGGRPFRDLEHCFDYIEQEVPYADTTNAVAMGGSYGGYLIYWLAGQPFASKFKALVAHAGIFNIPSLYASDVPDIWEVLFGGYASDPSQLIKNLGKWDLIQFVHLWKTPILITHGELDRRCPHTMGLAAFTMTQMRGVESKFLSFSDEGHFVLKPENALLWYRTVIDWMNRHTGKEEQTE
ncbi:alpha/beta-hydrolase [Mollisia scopiformis]|uniref:Dipeptidyl-peptidase V n=1 Tax=Mollisia scopiformis TaxID=149040 RepID=A0A194XR09_MOLSC|nr:alpha/beta-hydrolase [Mollisia scopiformis]KUJ22167.1 alpha/beta-hydrolase [Mollisia scopiformis]